jgi:hypothetical protein
MNSKLTFFLCVFLPLGTIAQNKTEDILQRPVFNSEVEKKHFAQIASTGTVDYYQLLINSTAPPAGFSTAQYETFIQSKDWFRNPRSFSAKELKKIYRDIHEAFFKQYTENPSFNQIFIDGNYNCVTASALYALLLDKLAVGYNIRETPTHVYIVAAPTSHNVVFETTTPGIMVYSLNEKAKTQYLEYLASNKIISKEELVSGDKNELFDKHFYNDKPITIRELAGLMYYNLGVASLGVNNYVEAYKSFEKAYFLYPGTKLKYVLGMSLTSVMFNTEKVSEEEKLPYLRRYLEVGDKQNIKEISADFFQKASKNYLFQHPDPRKFKEVYGIIISGITDSASLNELRHDYYMDFSHYYSAKQDADSSLLYLDSLYALNKNNLHVQELLGQVMQDKIREMPEKSAIDSIQYYFDKYPFIKSRSMLNEYFVYCLSRQVYTYYDNENAREGQKYLQLLRQVLDGKPALAQKSEQYTMSAVGEVCGYYVRRQEYKNARELLLFMKSLLPENEEVKRRLTHVEKSVGK